MSNKNINQITKARNYMYDGVTFTVTLLANGYFCLNILLQPTWTATVKKFCLFLLTQKAISATDTLGHGFIF